MFERAAAHLFAECYFPLLIIELYFNVLCDWVQKKLNLSCSLIIRDTVTL